MDQTVEMHLLRKMLMYDFFEANLLVCYNRKYVFCVQMYEEHNSVLQDVTDELKNYQSVMEALHEQAANLGEQVNSAWALSLMRTLL